MPSQLDILALEPFFGGARRHMLEAVIRCSRHRWTLLKLPPRRIERRLSVAASWFAEQLSRHWSGRMDVLFTSEAMNLSSLYRLAPELARQPSVVYFHENQLPDPAMPARKIPDGPRKEAPLTSEAVVTRAAQIAVKQSTLDMVNLNTAAAATEIWFNSNYHRTTFMASAARLVAHHSELSSLNPMADVSGKAHVMPPPLDFNLVPYVKTARKLPPRDPRAIFVDTRDANVRLLNAALSELASRGEKFRLITVGPIEALSDTWQRRTISEADDMAHVAGLWESGVILSVRAGAPGDLQVIRGLLAGCRPALPDKGVYAEWIPPALHSDYLYAPNVDALADRLQEAINPVMEWIPLDFRPNLKQFEAIAATRAFDDRFTQLVQRSAARA